MMPNELSGCLFRAMSYGPLSWMMQSPLILLLAYPKDEAPAVHKDFKEILNSVRLADPASEVAHLRARFVIKDSATA